MTSMSKIFEKMFRDKTQYQDFLHTCLFARCFGVLGSAQKQKIDEIERVFYEKRKTKRRNTFSL